MKFILFSRLPKRAGIRDLAGGKKVGPNPP